MTSPEEVKKLAALARVEIRDEDLDSFTREFDAIVGYVSKLEALTLPKVQDEIPAVRNVFRADTEPHDSGVYTRKIAEQFPNRKGDSLVVKQIISHD